MRVLEETVPAPVDVPALRAWLLAHAVPGVDHVETAADGASILRRRLPAGVGWLEVVLPDAAAPRLRSSAGRAGLDTGRRWLGLDLDPAPAVAALAGDPVLGPLVTARPLVRVPGAADPFEAAVQIILGQHVSLAAGRAFAGRLAAAGEVTAHALARADPAELRAQVGVTGARAATLVALARAVEDGLDLAAQPDATRRAALRRALLDLPGVGPWSADLVAMRCLRDPDVFLPGDLVLRRALGGVTAREAARLAEVWAPHRSLAVVHLWVRHALDPPR